MNNNEEIQMKELSIIVPVFNEEDSIEPFIHAINAVLNPLLIEYEIVFVNDGSSDNTLSILINHQKENNNIIIIDLSRNFGKERGA